MRKVKKLEENVRNVISEAKLPMKEVKDVKPSKGFEKRRDLVQMRDGLDHNRNISISLSSLEKVFLTHRFMKGEFLFNMKVGDKWVFLEDVHFYKESNLDYSDGFNKKLTGWANIAGEKEFFEMFLDTPNGWGRIFLMNHLDYLEMYEETDRKR